MSRSLLIGLICTALFFAGAFWLYDKLFGTPAGDIAVSASSDAGAVLSSKTTSPDAPSVNLYAKPKTYRADGGENSDAGPSLDAGAFRTAVDEKASVLAVSGFVQRGRVGGTWVKVQVGDELEVEDSIRTGRTGEARLAVGDGVEVNVSPRSRFSVREIQKGLSAVQLDVGHVSASVDEKKKRTLRVGAAGTDAVAETSGGTFGIVSDGYGQVAVATNTGQVKLIASGKEKVVPVGSQSVVLRNAEPSTPEPVPKSLLLKVADPVRRTTNETTTQIGGQVSPGSIVHVGERVAAVDKRGAFRVPVKLKEGKNTIVVAVTGPTGRTKKKALAPIHVDREKPKIDAKVKWGGD